MTRAGAATLLAAASLLAVALYRQGIGAPPLLVAAARVEAAATADLLARCGLAVDRRGALLEASSGFALEVTPDCTGWLALVLFLAGLLPLAARPGRKLLAALAGGVGLAIANVARLAALFWVGARAPASFDLAHRVGGELWLAATVLGLWALAARSPALTDASAIATRP